MIDSGLIHSELLLAFLFALLRIGGLVLLAPLFGGGSVPLRLRLLLAVAAASMIAMVCDPEPLSGPLHGGQLLVAACREAILGLVFGTAIVLLVAGLQAAGQLVGQLSGMSLAEAVEPLSGGSATGFGKLFELVGIAAFLLTGGHRQVLAALLDTFRWMPPGQVGFSAGLLATLHEIAAASFQLAVRAAAPVLLALLLAALVMGVIQRVVPQLNTLSFGFSLNALAALALVTLSLGGVAWTFQTHADSAIHSMAEAISRVPAERIAGGRQDE